MIATCINLLLTNRPSTLQHSNVFETGIPNVHLRVAAQFKMDFQKKLQEVKAYFNYKKKKKKKKKKTTLKFRDDVSNLAVDQFDVYNFKEAIFNII